ncbi:hypothetical protein BGZ99_002261, partial [Dissophora globulifera]
MSHTPTSTSSAPLNPTEELMLDYSFVAAPDVIQDLIGPAAFESSSTLRQRANLAIESCPGPLAQSENSYKALKTLQQYGLIVETQPCTTPVPIAHVLVSKILHPTTPLPKRTFTATLTTREGSTHLQVPSRLLVLREIAMLLGLDICVFSSRSAPRRFMAHDAKTTVVLFHNVDSYHSTGQFLVLSASSHDFMVPPPPQAPAQPVVPFHAAEFRNDQRARKRKATALQLDQEQCRQLFKQACIEAMKERVGAAVAKVIGKRNSNAELVEEGREKARGQLLGAKRLPAGVMGKMVDLAKETLGRDDLEANTLGNKAGDAEYRLHEWRVTLRSHVYDEAWDTAVQVEDDDDEVSRSDDDVNPDSTRTCTATLRQTMRNDVLPHFDRIVSLAEDAQNIVSNVMEEMA